MSSFNIRSSTQGAFTAASSVSQLVNAAQTPIYEPPADITVTDLNATTINTVSLSSNSGTNSYQTLGVENIVHPPTNALSVSGVNTSVLNKRTRTSQAAAEACVSTWTTRASAIDGEWASVCWSPELSLFCAVGESAVMISYDGVNWITGNGPAIFYPWSSVCWSPELGLFCAVITNFSDDVMTSPDGTNWTVVNTGFGNITRWYSVCWSPELGLFCAVGFADIGYIMTSSDGANWTLQYIGNEEDVLLSICWSPELSIFCVVGNNAMTSPDGVNWTLHTTFPEIFGISVCWSPELSLFCAVSDPGDRVMTSPNGVNWTSRTSASDTNWWSVCWSPELSIFCAVSSSGTGNRVMTSPDGVNWTSRTSASDNSWRSVCWSPELSIFCAVSSNGSGNRVMTSTIGMPNSQSVLKTNPSYMTVTQTGNVGISTAAPSERLEVTGNILASGTITPFTGAHITQSLYNQDDIGKIVSSTGHIQDISINNAWPRTILSSTEKDPAVYGVISEIKDNGIALVNGVGEGAILVCNRNGSISKGDLLTSSPFSGYTQKQDDNVIHSYTVARAIMDCSFDETEIKPVYEYQKYYNYRLEETQDQKSFDSQAFPDSKYYIKLQKNIESDTVTAEVKDTGSTVVDIEQSQLEENSLLITIPVEQVDGSKHPHTFEVSYMTGAEMFVIYLDISGKWNIKQDEMVTAYNVKYVDEKGTEITYEQYQQLLNDKEKVYKCAFIGCIYLCG